MVPFPLIFDPLNNPVVDAAAKESLPIALAYATTFLVMLALAWMMREGKKEKKEMREDAQRRENEIREQYEKNNSLIQDFSNRLIRLETTVNLKNDDT